MSDSSYLSGSKAIARALGVSERTIRRKAQSGDLPVIRKGRNTSPLMMKRQDVERLRRATPQRLAERAG